MSTLEGNILWICKSKQRVGHKRKNWFINCSILVNELPINLEIKKSDVNIKLFHCGGNGGQNVNKVETGVRMKHIPTGIVVESIEERTQALNKANCYRKLEIELRKKNAEIKSRNTNNAWKNHTSLVRGNPVRVYEGPDFELKNK